MEQIIVLLQKGKGYDSVDKVSVKLFTNKKDAEDFIEKNTDLVSKYWTYAEIIKEGEIIELFCINYVQP